MSIHTLPLDVVAHIGTFLCQTDVRSCLETAKCFRSIACGWDHHMISCGQHNKQARLSRLLRTYAYIRQIKPAAQIVINLHFLTMNNIDHDLQGVITLAGMKNTIIQLTYSQQTSNVLTVLPTDSHVRVISSFINEQDVTQLCRLKCDFLYTLVNDTNVRLLRQYGVSHISDIYLTISSLSQQHILDLSCIDITHNKHLEVSYVGHDFACIDPYKITAIEENAMCDEPTLELLYESCLRDPRFHASRMQNVYIYRNTKITRHNIWFRFVKILPRHTQYNVAIHDPCEIRFVSELHQNGARYIKYLCYNEETYHNAMMYNALFPNDKVELEQNRWLRVNRWYPSTTPEWKNNTMHEDPANIYNQMSPHNRTKWRTYTPLIFPERKGCFLNVFRKCLKILPSL